MSAISNPEGVSAMKLKKGLRVHPIFQNACASKFGERMLGIFKALDKMTEIQAHESEQETHQKMVAEQERKFMKQSLAIALATEDPDKIYQWCYMRAIWKTKKDFANMLLLTGVEQPIPDAKIRAVVDRWHRWYYRICKWWNIDHSWGKPN